MSINEQRSYTEYNVEVPTTDFPIGFDILDDGIDVVAVTLNDVDPATLGYTVTQVNNTTYRFAPAVPSGVVRLTRITDIDRMLHVFTEGAIFVSENIDSNFKQIRHSQQDVQDNFRSLVSSTSARLGTFSYLVDNLNSEFISTRDVVSDLVTISADTVNTANNAFNTANAIDAKASTALSNSSVALNTATGIDAKATDALDNSLAAVLDSSAALSTANAIDAKATEALTDSAEALSSATTALNTANATDGKATQALTDSATALTTATGALKKSSNLSDVASATVARTNLGVMSASEVATAISNATSTIPNATETTKGIIELATQSEVNSALDNERAVTPAKLFAGLRNHLNVTGIAPMFACRAWVNFNGTGTVAIRASGNVSSITDNGVGDYTVNFAMTMPDANYAVTGFAIYPTNTIPVNTFGFGNDYTQTLSGSVRVKTANQANGTMLDPTYVNVIIHR